MPEYAAGFAENEIDVSVPLASWRSAWEVAGSPSSDEVSDRLY
jgi:hypothetical protein